MKKFMLGLAIWPILFWYERKRLVLSAGICFYFSIGVLAALATMLNLPTGNLKLILSGIVCYVSSAIMVRMGLEEQNNNHKLF